MLYVKDNSKGYVFLNDAYLNNHKLHKSQAS